MSAFSISPLIVERLGWILVHSVWQFALIALLAGAAVRILRGKTAALRYGVLVVAMIVSGCVPAITWKLQPGASAETQARQTVLDGEPVSVAAGNPAVEILRLDGQPMTATGSNDERPAIEIAASSIPLETRSAASPATPANLDFESSWPERAATFLRPWLAWIVAAWSLGALLCSLRPLLGWHTLRRLRRVGVSPVSDDVQAALRRLSRRIGVRRAVRVLHTTLAQVPLVVGYARPVILLPVSLVTSIPASQLEAILFHELAHVRRHDFLVNLLQTLVETVFFYHPAIWWLSRRIRAERENCCDDLVVAALGNRVEYGRALLAIEELRGSGTVLALGAADGSLSARVRRIVGLPSDSAGSSPWPALSLVVCGIVFVGAISFFNWHGLATVPGDDFPTSQPSPASETDLQVSAEPLPLEQAAAKAVDNVATATGDAGDSWPPRDPAAFLKRLYQRDVEFNNRSVRVERRWVEHVEPRAVIAGEQQIRENKGLPQIVPPPDDEIPAAYDQPHRARYLMTARQIELAFDNAADLETMKHPRYAKPVQAKRWPGLPPIAWNTVMMEGRMWLEQERRLKRKSFEWTCGYGFAGVIETIDSIRVEDNRLVIEGKLREFLNYSFTREERAKTGPPNDRFEIELDRDLIVRRAVLEIAAEPVRKSRWIYQADRYRRFVLETSGTVRPPNAPPVAAEGRYQVIVQNPQDAESVLHDETSAFLDISDTLTDEEFKRRLSPDRQLDVLADPQGDQQEVEIETPSGGKVEFTFRLVR